MIQSELETKIYQPEVNTSEETTPPEHEPDADACAGAVPPPPAGPPPTGPEPVIPRPPAVRPRRRWQLGLQQTQEEQDEEFRRDRLEFLHLEGRLKEALDRMEEINAHLPNATGNELQHYEEKRTEQEMLIDDLPMEIEKVRCLQMELWQINGRRHPPG